MTNTIIERELDKFNDDFESGSDSEPSVMADNYKYEPNSQVEMTVITIKVSWGTRPGKL